MGCDLRLLLPCECILPGEFTVVYVPTHVTLWHAAAFASIRSHPGFRVFSCANDCQSRSTTAKNYVLILGGSLSSSLHGLPSTGVIYMAGPYRISR